MHYNTHIEIIIYFQLLQNLHNTLRKKETNKQNAHSFVISYVTYFHTGTTC
jgi:hypothetical protein